VRLLLDTHSLLWWLADDARLGDAARELIADPANDVFVSTVSLWEIVVKVRIGKLAADIGEIAQAVDAQGLQLLDIGLAHLTGLAALPTHHRDPFDHLLIAQAIAEDLTFLTQDANAPAYPVTVISCA
jgi:PIN domain nuclease of toxin-antitoxin system